MAEKGDILELAASLRHQGESFALATVVRTVAATAAKAGAKAVIRPDGSISEGWIGGGCARAAVLKAARQAIGDGQPRLVSIQPADLLDALGVAPDQERDGVRFAQNACPSEGTMDIFIEPMLPKPELFICGASPVAVALADLGGRLGFSTTICAPARDQAAFATADRRVEGYDFEAQNLEIKSNGRRFIVISTQGKGDEAALRAAGIARADYLAFVGSGKKMAALRAKLRAEGIEEAALARIKAPAGLDLGAITPEEIALSILGEIIALRRKAQMR